MDMRDIPANCTLSKVVYGVMTVGTMFCKDNVQDSRITESLPKDWTISSFKIQRYGHTQLSDFHINIDTILMRKTIRDETSGRFCQC